MVDEVVSFYINIGDRNILKMFVVSVFWRLKISGTGYNKNDWIEAVIKSAIDSAATTDVIIQSVKRQIDIVKVLAVEPTAIENNRRISLTRFFSSFSDWNGVFTWPMLQDLNCLHKFTRTCRQFD